MKRYFIKILLFFPFSFLVVFSAYLYNEVSLFFDLSKNQTILQAISSVIQSTPPVIDFEYRGLPVASIALMFIIIAAIIFFLYCSIFIFYVKIYNHLTVGFTYKKANIKSEPTKLIHKIATHITIVLSYIFLSIIFIVVPLPFTEYARLYLFDISLQFLEGITSFYLSFVLTSFIWAVMLSLAYSLYQILVKTKKEMESEDAHKTSSF